MSELNENLFTELFRYLNRDLVKGGLNEFDIQAYSITDFNDIPEVPGLYSWHLFLNKLSDDRVKQYNKFYRSNSYRLTLEGNLSEILKGNATGEVSERFQERTIDLDRPDKPLNRTLLALSSFIFNPPLYIGRSSQLHTRLNKHLTQFDDYFDEDLDILAAEKYIKQNEIYTEKELEERKRNGESVVDNDDESKFFGQRLGYYLTKCQGENDTVINKNNLFVNVISLKNPDKITEVDLNEIEYILNRSFTPLLGRK